MGYGIAAIPGNSDGTTIRPYRWTSETPVLRPVLEEETEQCPRCGEEVYAGMLERHMARDHQCWICWEVDCQKQSCSDEIASIVL